MNQLGFEWVFVMNWFAQPSLSCGFGQTTSQNFLADWRPSEKYKTHCHCSSAPTQVKEILGRSIVIAPLSKFRPSQDGPASHTDFSERRQGGTRGHKKSPARVYHRSIEV